MAAAANKLEIRIPKSETNPNDRNASLKSGFADWRSGPLGRRIARRAPNPFGPRKALAVFPIAILVIRFPNIRALLQTSTSAS
jgi:hypothetical protein